MAKITILIEGIGLIYEKADKWKVLFPFDSQHRVKFMWRVGVQDNIELLAMEDGEINISVKYPENNHTVDTTIFNSFFNIKDVHENGLATKSDWNERGVLLSIPNATMSRRDETKSKFIVTKKGKKIKDLGSIGYNAKAEIDLKEGGSLTVEAKNADGVFFSRTFSGQDLTIMFDNDCPTGLATEITDFAMLYSILEDIPTNPQDPKRRFSIERHPDSKPKLLFEINADSKLKLTTKSLSEFSSLAEKFLINPRQFLNTNLKMGEVGVPCHMVISDKTEKLP
jgi:hypothetical protein